MDKIGLINLNTELPKFLTDFLQKNEIPDTEKKQVTEQVTKLLGNADKNESGKGDGYVTYDEVLSYIENPKAPKISADLSGKVLKALNAWDSIAAKEFQTKLQTPKEISVEKFIRGASPDSFGAEGTVTLDWDKEYQFALYDTNLVPNPSKPKSEPKMVLRLTDSQGNSISLDEEHIPKTFTTAVKNNKPLNSNTLRTPNNP
jgi:hypothetical protein